MNKEIKPDLLEKLLFLQREELNGQILYEKLSQIVRDSHNRQVLKRISEEEKKHYKMWKKNTQSNVSPNHLKINIYFWLAKILGPTFGIKLMENDEEKTQYAYLSLMKRFPDAKKMLIEEEKHESKLVDMLNEERLKYAGSVVLGLNDALVELTGALAGFTFAFQNTQLIALAGLITGISASFSMAASEYLSNKAEGSEQDPLKSSIYTGIAYIFTVIFLVLPYLLIGNPLLCLLWTILNAIIIIAAFNYYLSVVKDLSFRKRFLEMSAISLGVAFFSFIIGILIRQWFNIDI